MRVLTLFSGTGSITRALTHFSNAEEVTLDLNEPADIMEDILTWDPTIFAPGAFDIVFFCEEIFIRTTSSSLGAAQPSSAQLRKP